MPSDLVAAIIRNDARAVDALLASGADPNAADADGVTPLMAAASERADERIAKALIARGADVNATDRWGETALHMAVGRGDPSLVVLFLDHGADVVEDLVSPVVDGQDRREHRLDYTVPP